MDDYEWYVKSCNSEQVRPMSRRRFDICLKAWREGHNAYYALDLLSLTFEQRRRTVRRWKRLNQVARFADAGRGVVTAGTVTTLPPVLPDAGSEPQQPILERPWDAPSYAETIDREAPIPSALLEEVARQQRELGNNPGPEDPPPAAPPDDDEGVRVPREPIDPSLSGSASREIPKSEADREPRPYAS